MEGGGQGGRHFRPRGGFALNFVSRSMLRKPERERNSRFGPRLRFPPNFEKGALAAAWACFSKGRFRASPCSLRPAFKNRALAAAWRTFPPGGLPRSAALGAFGRRIFIISAGLPSGNRVLARVLQAPALKKYTERKQDFRENPRPGRAFLRSRVSSACFLSCTGVAEILAAFGLERDLRVCSAFPRG